MRCVLGGGNYNHYIAKEIQVIKNMQISHWRVLISQGKGRKLSAIMLVLYLSSSKESQR